MRLLTIYPMDCMTLRRVPALARVLGGASSLAATEGMSRSLLPGNTSLCNDQASEAKGIGILDACADANILYEEDKCISYCT